MTSLQVTVGWACRDESERSRETEAAARCVGQRQGVRAGQVFDVAACETCSLSTFLSAIMYRLPWPAWVHDRASQSLRYFYNL